MARAFISIGSNIDPETNVRDAILRLGDNLTNVISLKPFGWSNVLALADAVAAGSERHGRDLSRWAWGRVRPFVLKHLFAGRDGILGWFLNSAPMPIAGGTETVFKQQFLRSDRAHLHPAVGPIVRFTIDMADPWAATYTLAGGESGWPRSPFYGNLLQDWRQGRERPLTPGVATDDLRVRCVPGA